MHQAKYILYPISLCCIKVFFIYYIITGHTVFEMAAGYELTHLRPSQADYKAVDRKIRPILELIFEQGFPHSISEVATL